MHKVVHRAVREPADGEADTGGARSVVATSRWALPAAGAAGQGERGEHPDERGAKRRREEDTAVTTTTPSNLGRGVSVRQRR